MDEQVEEAPVAADGAPSGGSDVESREAASAHDPLGPVPAALASAPTGLSSLYGHDVIPQIRSLPLESVLERSTRGLEVALRKVALDTVEVGLSRTETTRCRVFLDGVAEPALLAVIRTSWGGPLVIELGTDIISMLVAMTFGGGAAGGVAAAIEGRGFTPIEMRVARRLVDELIRSLAGAMSAIAPVTLDFELFESTPRLVDAAPPHSLAVVAHLEIRVGQKTTGLKILLPQATLGPVQHLLAGHRPRESAGEDGLWEEHMKRETMASVVAVDARLCRKTASLQEVLALAIGDTVVFEAAPDQPIDLVCGDKVVARAKIGRSRERLAVKIVSSADPADRAA